jgi:hypothetical protein
MIRNTITASLAVTAALSLQDDEAQFKQYMHQFDKSYATNTEYLFRL